jgi:hypothetical protein
MPNQTHNSLHTLSPGRFLSLLAALVGLAVGGARPLRAAEPDFATFHAFGNAAFSTSVVAGDLNGDGTLDLVIGNMPTVNESGRDWIYLNDGRGILRQQIPLGSETAHTTAIALADLNGDGLLDLILAHKPQSDVPGSGRNLIYLNEGGATFSAAIPFGDLEQTTSLAVADLNGDGAFDIIVGNGSSGGEAGQNRLFFNDTSGGFATSLPFGEPGDTTALVVGDFNGDRWPDVAVSLRNQPHRVFLNDGEGRLLFFTFFGSDLGATVAMATADFNGDGSLDIVLDRNGQVFVYLNDGGGKFATSIQVGERMGVYSIAAGDVNGNGAPDIVIGHHSTQQSWVYLNDGAADFTHRLPFGDRQQRRGLALVDLDDNGTLDIVSANYNSQNQIFFNREGGGFAPPLPLDTGSERSECVAAGDFNGDGLLDLLVCNSDIRGATDMRDQIFWNEGNGAFRPGPRLGENNDTHSVAVGDLNGDGALDIVVAHLSRSRVYLNDGAGSFAAGQSIATAAWMTWDVVLGDFNGDGALDLVLANGPPSFATTGGQNELYLNDGSGRFTLSMAFGKEGDTTRSIAVGDINGDGALDVATGNYDRPVQVFLNDGGGALSPSTVITGPERILKVVLGDFDGNGTLDIVAGSNGQQSRIFFNDGNGGFDEGIPFGHISNVWGLAAGDFNGDGALDLVTGNSLQFDRVYLNDGAGRFGAGTPLGALDYSWSVAVGDFDRDGALDLVVGKSGKFHLYRNHFRPAAGGANHPPSISAVRPVATGDANFQSSPVLLEEQIISISYTLADPEGDPVGRVEAFYSLDGGGRWLPAIATTRTVTSHLTTSPTGVTHRYHWDTFASGFFGQTDSLVLRLVAHPQPAVAAEPGTYRYPRSVAGSLAWPSISVTTFPLRARGTQVHVVAEGDDGIVQGVKGARVYRLPAARPANLAQPLVSPATQRPFLTDANGYLQGRGVLQIGDQLVALAPVAATQNFTLYHTSAAVTQLGLDLQPVTEPGVQLLTVSPDRPLMLFNLVVSLEWDARPDTGFLGRLQDDLHKTSQILYDLTNGQAALGEIHLYYDRGHWGHANVVVQASNQQRPSAILGGIVSSPITDVIVTSGLTSLYIPGQVRMPPIWNRFGNREGVIGEDWPRALAHELGHYLFFLPDNYLGLSPTGMLALVDCKGSAMTDPYDLAYSEFLHREEWLGDCEKSLAAHYLNRSDWETITRFYPQLTGRPPNSGPNGLPLAVTQVTSFANLTATLPLADPFFKLEQADGSPATPTPGRAEGYLIKGAAGNDIAKRSIIALGAPVGDRLHARGATPGDRLCVIDYSGAPLQIGCTEVENYVTPVRLEPTPGWAPVVTVTPVTTTTVTVTLTNEISLPVVLAQLLPVRGAASPVVTMTAITGEPSTWVAMLAAPEGAYFGFVRVWAPDTTPPYEMVVEFANKADWPGQAWAWGAQQYDWEKPAWGWGGQAWAWGGQAWAWGGQAWAWGAPLMSSDGQVSIFPLDNPFGGAGDFALQQLPFLPTLPDWLTPVGQAYRLSADKTLPRSAIIFRYLMRDVPASHESSIRIYHSDDEGQSWRPLETTLYEVQNHAAAALAGAGIYLLAITLPEPLAAGINPVSYPVQETRPVAETLASIAGHYSYVCHYNAGSTSPWACYYPAVQPPFDQLVNQLTHLEYRRVYFIHATQAITLYFGVADPDRPSDIQVSSVTQPAVLAPPATYYGWITPTATFTLTSEMRITAEINGILCGEAPVLFLEGRPVYVLQVAVGSSREGRCGELGSTVVLKLDGQIIHLRLPWDNRQAWFEPLTIEPGVVNGDYHLYLPYIQQE